MPGDTQNHNGDRVLPRGAAIMFSASDTETRRYYFPVPWSEYDDGFFSTVAPDAETAKQSMADEHAGVSPAELPEPSLNREEAQERDGGEWPDFHEKDIWRLRHDPRPSARRRYHQSHDRPSRETIDRVLTHWDDIEDIPLGDPERLQEAHGIGPVRATQFAGAAAADGLVDRVDT